MKQMPSFEESAVRVEEILARLERGDVPLEQALGLFEEGMKLTAHCQKLLDKAEQKVVLLTRDPGGEVTGQPFSPQE